MSKTSEELEDRER